MASLRKHLQHATFIFSVMHAKHVTQSWFSLVACKTAYIILHDIDFASWELFSVICLGYKHTITYIYSLPAFQKTGTIVALPPKTIFRKKEEIIVGLAVVQSIKN